MMAQAAQLNPAVSRENELYWLALKMVPGLGARRTYSLIKNFGSPRRVFEATKRDLEGCGVAPGIAATIESGCTFDEAASQHGKLLQFGAQLISIQDERYPEALRQIYDPPVMLFVKGRIELLSGVLIGVIGTRRASTYGMAAAERLSSDLAKAGLVIVSGMAMGIDTAAHKAALASDGDTIAVFGCGVDMIYPAENRKLASTIAEKGLLVSEFPMGAAPLPQNFPVRNRIISGMSFGVLVVEGAQYSGSAITARIAMDQQREVFAVPGNITNKMSWAPNLLIKQGAKLVQEWNDVVTELPVEARRRLVVAGQQALGLANVTPESTAAQTETRQGTLGRALLRHLQVDQAIHMDALLESFEGHSSSELIAALFELEMEGAVRQLPGKTFVKVW